MTLSERGKIEDALDDPVHAHGPLSLPVDTLKGWLAILDPKAHHRSNRTKVGGSIRLHVRDQPAFFPIPPVIIFPLLKDPNRTKAICEILYSFAGHSGCRSCAALGTGSVSCARTYPTELPAVFFMCRRGGSLSCKDL